jgi:hypothetical protein
MPITYYDEEGNAVELPVESVEEITTLKTSAEELKQKVEKYEGDENYKGLRTAREKAEEDATKSRELLKKHGIDPENPEGALNEDRVKNIAQETVLATKQAEVEAEKEHLLDQISGGDNNKRKALQAKLSEITGGQKFSDIATLTQKLQDASYLLNRGREEEPSMMNKINTPLTGGGPKRKEDIKNRSKAVEALNAFGYKFKGKQEDYQ